MSRQTKWYYQQYSCIVALAILVSVLFAACEGHPIYVPWQGTSFDTVPVEQVAAVDKLDTTVTNTPFLPILDSEGQPGLTAAAVQQLSTATDTETPTMVLMSRTPDKSTETMILTTETMITGTVPTSTVTFTLTNSFTPSLTLAVSRSATNTLILSSATPRKTGTSTPTRTQTQPGVQNTATLTRTFTKTSLPSTQTYTSVVANTQTFTPVVVSTRTFTSTSVPTAIPADCVYSENYAYESTLIGMINDLRTSLSLTPYTSNSLLGNAARGHSQDMACNDYFSHTGLDGSTVGSRVASEGYSYSWVGENIYAGSGSYGTPQMAYNYWYNSSAHYANMTNTNYTEIGIGFITCADSTYQNYFTANFARP
jgi:uncharacterized protein YkwD